MHTCSHEYMHIRMQRETYVPIRSLVNILFHPVRTNTCFSPGRAILTGSVEKRYIATVKYNMRTSSVQCDRRTLYVKCIFLGGCVLTPGSIISTFQHESKPTSYLWLIHETYNRLLLFERLHSQIQSLKLMVPCDACAPPT